VSSTLLGLGLGWHRALNFDQFGAFGFCLYFGLLRCKIASAAEVLRPGLSAKGRGTEHRQSPPFYQIIPA
jgi:hypothetical protein